MTQNEPQWPHTDPSNRLSSQEFATLARGDATLYLCIFQLLEYSKHSPSSPPPPWHKAFQILIIITDEWSHAWVTWSERPKGAKDNVKQAQRVANLKSGPLVLNNLPIFLSS